MRLCVKCVCEEMIRAFLRSELGLTTEQVASLMTSAPGAYTHEYTQHTQHTQPHTPHIRHSSVVAREPVRQGVRKWIGVAQILCSPTTCGMHSICEEQDGMYGASHHYPKISSTRRERERERERGKRFGERGR